MNTMLWKRASSLSRETLNVWSFSSSDSSNLSFGKRKEIGFYRRSSTDARLALPGCEPVSEVRKTLHDKLVSRSAISFGLAVPNSG